MQRTIQSAFLTLIILFGAVPAFAGTPGYTFSACPVDTELTNVDAGDGTWCPSLWVYVSQVSLGIKCDTFAAPVNINLRSSHPDLCEAADIAFRVMSGESVSVDSVGRFGVGSSGHLFFAASEISEFAH